MENMLHINYLTRAYQGLMKSYEMKEKTPIPKAFAENVEAVLEAAKNAGIDKISKSDMTMEEYKAYIYNKISAIPIHPTQMQDTISIHISDAGFEAMKKDPEYEAWVLDYLKRDLAFNNPWAMAGGRYHVEHFGASVQEHIGQSWYPEYQNGRGSRLYKEKSKDAFWERRAEREIQRREQQKELYDERLINNPPFSIRLSAYLDFSKRRRNSSWQKSCKHS